MEWKQFSFLLFDFSSCISLITLVCLFAWSNNSVGHSSFYNLFSLALFDLSAIIKQWSVDQGTFSSSGKKVLIEWHYNFCHFCVS